MRSSSLLLAVLLVGCGPSTTSQPTETPQAGTGELGTAAQPTATAAQPTATAAPAAPKVTVVMASATLADDCPGEEYAPTPPATPEPVETRPTEPVWKGAKGATKADEAPRAKGKSRRRCEQSTMQLSIQKTPGAPVKLQVKKVEIFDEEGRSLGVVTPREPSIWTSEGTYVPWDERVVVSSQVNVSYALSEPAWGSADRRNKTYLVRATVEVDGEAQSTSREVAVQKEVIIQAPTSLPAMVKT